MAKWKNALLISTIVAPIAFGASPLGDALAQARPGTGSTTPYTAVDVHKMLKTTSGTAENDKQNIFWGDGTEATANAFFGANGWSAATNAADKYEFTAYRLDLGNKVITGYEPAKTQGGAVNDDAGMPIFSTTDGLTLNGVDYKWSDLLTATKVPTTGVNQDNRVNGKAKETVSEYTISLTLPSGVTPQQFQTAMKAAEDSYIADYNSKQENESDYLKTSDYYMQDKTDASGVAAFDGAKALHNGQWVIFETSHPDYVASGEEAVPMVLNLPMQKAAAAYSDTGWFGTAEKDHLNLYAKNYTQKGDLTVEKQDSKTGDGVEGAWIGLFTDLVTQDIANSISAEVKDLDPSSATITSQIETAVETGIEKAVGSPVDLSDYLVAVGDTQENGKVKFNNLEPNKTYGVLELVEPAGYTVNSTLKSITLSPADAVKDSSDATDEDASDGAVYFQGGEYDFGNFTPKVDKSIQVTGQTGWTGQGVEGKEDNKIDADDDHQGVDRGEDFKWLIQSDLPADGTIFTTYKLTDTLPYQTNWYSALVDVAGVDLVNVQHINPQGKGGLTGNGITYDNQKDGNAMKITAIDADGTITEEATGQTLKSGVEMTKVSGAYDNLVSKLGRETVDNLIDTTVTTDEQLADWLNDHLNVSGRSSYYKFDTDNRTVLADQKKDGELVIAPDDEAQALFSALAKVAGEDARTLNVTLDARTNSAAQAAIIDNKVQFDVANDYDSEKDKDNVKTFDAGWEIVKTTEDGKTPLAGAGFDLAVQIDDKAKQEALLNNLYDATTDSGDKIYDSEDTTVAAVWLNMFTEAAKSSQFEGYTYNGDPVNELTPEQLQQAAYQTVEAGDEDTKTNLRATLISMTKNSDYDVDGQNTLFFMHKDAKTGEPMAEMDSNASGSTDPMGDIIWTPVQAWATTHFSGDDGYLQYCGLAAGTYALIEVKAPEGYSMISSTVHLGTAAGGMDLKHAQKFELGVNQDGTLNTGTINGNPDYADSANPDMIVKNYQKSIFPLVGGLGTLFAVIAGLLAMGLALLKRKKDMKNEA